jgi:hypothetical protein
MGRSKAMAAGAAREERRWGKAAAYLLFYVDFDAYPGQKGSASAR